MILPYIIEQSIFIGWVDVEWTNFTNLFENIGFVCFSFQTKILTNNLKHKTLKIIFIFKSRQNAFSNG
jgi:hypothetical protein